MRIEYIKLYNYRLYKGFNQIDFPKDGEKNIFVIYGENGFGKTTFLQSLMWCIYGRMIIDVDDTSRVDINTKGYENYLRGNLNVEIGQDATSEDKNYYVEILLSELHIPTMPSANLTIKRTFDVSKNKETFELFIDGHVNELARQIGYDVFVNDFVLNKDIARLFFFDSERIVKLAEGQSKDERMRLGAAYNQVIGIKKYDDLRINLEGILLKMKKEALDEAGEMKYVQLISGLKELENEINQIENEITEINNKREAIKQEFVLVQTQLLREGSIIDLEAKKKVVADKEVCVQRNQDFKRQLKDYLEYAPFAIAGSLFQDAMRRIEHDYKVAESNNGFIRQKETINAIKRKLEDVFRFADISHDEKERLVFQTATILSEYQVDPINEPVLLNVDKEAYHQAESFSNMLYTTFQGEFKTMLEEYKRNKQQIDKLNKILHRADVEEGSDRIVKLKKQLAKIEKDIIDADNQVLEHNALKAAKNQEKEKFQAQYDKYHASMMVREKNKEKSELISVLINEISDYLTKIRPLKNKSIETRVKRILNSLMHKNDFVDKIFLETEDNDFEVRLYKAENEIQKKSLSKGEQQLYASALLMALVEEAGIEFPVFIDSPLQKFDKKHAERIITDFYPKVSNQVVLLPIADKELTPEEEMLMQPNVKGRYCIINDGMHSSIKKICSNR